MVTPLAFASTVVGERFQTLRESTRESNFASSILFLGAKVEVKGERSFGLLRCCCGWRQIKINGRSWTPPMWISTLRPLSHCKVCFKYVVLILYVPNQSSLVVLFMTIYFRLRWCTTRWQLRGFYQLQSLSIERVVISWEISLSCDIIKKNHNAQSNKSSDGSCVVVLRVNPTTTTTTATKTFLNF